MKNTVNSILSHLKESISVEGIPFMEGRTPEQLADGEVVTICDYAYITDKKTNESYPVYIVKEDEEHFYFGGLVLKQLFEELDKFDKDEISAVLENGIKISAEKKTSKNKRTYTKISIL